MPSVDNRIVKLTFDNQQFLNGVSKVMTAVTALNSVLSMKNASTEAQQNISKIQKSVDSFDIARVNDSLDSLKARFSTLGIIGMSTVKNLTDTAINTVKRGVSTILGTIKSAGINRAMNIEQAKFQLNGLGVAWDEIVDDINYGVEDTAYGLDAAAKAASQLKASGVTLGKDMKSSLRGISGVAAMTNSSFEDISEVFTTVAGNGRLMANELNRLAARGLNVAAAMAESETIIDKFGKVTEKDIRELTSKGQIDFMTFAKAMDEAFGEHAKEANKTFTGAMSNVKAALGRIGADIVTPFIKQHPEGSLYNLIDVLNSIKPVINSVKKALQPLIGEGNRLEKFVSKVSKSLVDFFNRIDEDKVTTFINKLMKFFNGGIMIGKALFGLLKTVGSGLLSMLKALLPPLDSTGDGFLNLAQRISKAINSFTETIKKLGIFNFFTEKIKKAVQIVLAIAKPLWRLIKTIGSGIVEIFSRIIPYIDDISGDGLLNLAQKFGAFIDRITVSFKKLGIIEFLGDKMEIIADYIFQTIGIIRDVLSGQYFKEAGGGLGGILNSILALIQNFITEFIFTLSTFFGLDLSKVIKGIDAFFNKLREIVIKYSTNITNYVKDFTKTHATLLETIKNVLSNFGEFLLKIWNFTKDIFVKINSFFVKGLFDPQGVDKSVSNIKILSSAVGVLNRVFEFLGNILKAVLPALGRAAGTISKGLSEAIKEIGIGIIELVKIMFDEIKNMDFDEIIGIIETVFLGKLGLSISKLINKFSDGLAKGFTGLKEVFHSLSGYLRDMQKQVKANTLKTLAEGLLMIAIAALLLSTIPVEDLTKATAALGALMYELVAAMEALNKLSTTGKMYIWQKTTSTTHPLVQMGAALLLIAGACMMLASLDVENLIKAIAAIGILMQMLVSMAKELETTSKPMKLWEKNSNDVGKTIMKIAEALLIIAVAMKIIGTMEWEDLSKGIVVMGALLGFIYVLSSMMKNRQKRYFVELTDQLTKLAFSLILLSIALKIMGSMKWESIIKCIVTLGLLLLFIKGMGMIIGENAAKFTTMATALVILSAALTIMATALLIFNFIKVEAIFKFVVALAALCGALYLLKTIGDPATILGMSAALLVLAAAMVAIGAAIFLFGLIPIDKFVKGMLMFAAAILGFAILSSVVEKFMGSMLKLAGVMMVMSVAVALLGAGIFLLSVGLASLIALGPALIGAIYTMITTILNLLPMIVKIIVNFIVSLVTGIADAAVAIFAALKTIILNALDMLREIVPPLIETVMEILVKLLDALVQNAPKICDDLFQFIIILLDKLIEYVPQIIQKVIELIIAIAQGVIDAINNLSEMGIDWGPILLALAGMSAVMFLMAALPLAGAIKAVLVLAIFIAGLTAILVALGEINKIPGIKELVENGGELLSAIGYALGNFIGSIVAGFGTALADSLPHIAQQLSLFMVNLQPFLLGLKTIDPQVLAGCFLLVATMTMFTAGSLITAVADFLSGGKLFTNFGKKMLEFAPYILEFVKILDPLTEESVRKAYIAAACVATLANGLPKEGGLLSVILGESDAEKFGKSMPVLGEGIAEFTEAVASVDEDAVKKAVNAATAISELAKGLPNSGGLLGKIVGENDADKFGNMLKPLGEGIAAFSEAVQDVDKEAVEKAVNAATAISELASGLPNSGGLVGKIVGENDADKFGDMLKPLGEGLAEFSKATEEMKPDVVNKATNAAQAIAAMAKELPNDGGFVSWWTGDNKLSDFAEQIKVLGEGIADYYDAVKGCNFSQTYALNSTVDTLIAAAIDTKKNEVGNSLKDFSSQLGDYAGNMKTFVEKLDEISFDETQIGSMKLALQTLIVLSKEIKEADPDLTTFSLFSPGIIEIADALQYYINTLGDFKMSDFPEEDIDLLLTNILGIVGHLKRVQIGTTMEEIKPFADNLKPLGEGLSDFAEATKDILSYEVKYSDLKKIVDQVIGIMTTIKRNWYYIVDLSTFASSTRQIGSALTKFTKDVADIEDISDKTAMITNATTSILEQMKRIHDAWKYVKDISLFSQEVTYIKTALTDYVNAFSFIDFDTVDYDGIATALEEVLTQVASLADYDFSNVDDFTTAVSNLATAMNGVITSFGNVSEVGLKDFLEQFDNEVNANKASEAGASFMNHIKEGMTNKFMELNGYVKELFDSNKAHSLIMVLENAYSTYKDKAEALMKAVKTGFENEDDNAVKAVTDMLTKIQTTLEDEDTHKKFVDAGTWAVEGFTAGLCNIVATTEACRAAWDLGNAVYLSLQEGLDEHSPSKKTEKAGVFAVKGLVNGLQQNEEVKKTMTDLAKDIYTPLFDASKNSKSGFDWSVTPVYDLKHAKWTNTDLSSITSAKLGNSISGRLKGNLENKLTIQTTNNDVVGAISELKDEIIDLKSDMTHMKVVLDSNKLVGGITPQMNQSLGKKMAQQSRRM